MSHTTIDLGWFLRERREALRAPATTGIRPRRTPGLRREEVAQAAGVSVTWYTWIEQGRDVSPLPLALSRLAGVLQLDRAERAYMFELAGRFDPAPLAEEDEAAALPALAACVRAIRAPAYVLDRGWNAVLWNEPAADLFAGWLDGDTPRNLLRFVFLAASARRLISGWEQRCVRLVAEFRKDAGAHAEEPPLRGLIEELRAGSALFAKAWDRHGVTGRAGGRRDFDHPTLGRLGYIQTSFDAAGHAGLKLHILTPAGDEASACPAGPTPG